MDNGTSGADPAIVVDDDAGSFADLQFATRELLDAIGVPALITDTHRRGLWANQGFLDLFDITGTDRGGVVGIDMRQVSVDVSREFVDPDAFLAGITRSIEGGVPTSGDVLEHRSGRMVARGFYPIRRHGEIIAYLWRYDDVTGEHRRRRALERSTKVLEAMVRAHGPGVREAAGRDVFSALLRGLIELSGSEYGFVGEVAHGPDGPFLRSWAVSDIAWDIATKNAFRTAMRDHGYLEFHQLDTLYGHTLRTGERVIANDPSNDPRAGGLPPGHPPLVAYLGLPIHLDGQMIGMTGLAGRPGGYDEEVVELLQPLLTACASLIDAYTIERERKAAEAALREAVAAAESANAAKTRLLGRVSHELRTPLNAVLGFAQLLARGENDPRRARWLAQIEEAGQHVLSQVEDLLDIAAAEAGHLSLDPKPVDVDALVSAVLDLVQPLAAAQQVRTQAQPSHVWVHADPDRLRVVLINLVSNAIKYNSAGGNVTVTAHATVVPQGGAPMIELSVTDDGPGLADEQFERAFTMFERLDGADRGVPGTGLGLAIARDYVHAMGGTIIGRTAPGGGAQVLVTLPACAGPDVDDLMASEDRRWVLYVEDNPANAELVVEYLGQVDGLRVEVAPTLAAARTVLAERRPDLLLLDLNLPDGHGGVLAEQTLTDTPELPVIVITADAFAASELSKRLPEISAVVVKPVRFDVLSELVAQHVQSRR